MEAPPSDLRYGEYVTRLKYIGYLVHRPISDTTSVSAGQSTDKRSISVAVEMFKKINDT